MGVVFILEMREMINRLTIFCLSSRFLPVYKVGLCETQQMGEPGEYLGEEQSEQRSWGRGVSGEERQRGGQCSCQDSWSVVNNGENEEREVETALSDLKVLRH